MANLPVIAAFTASKTQKLSASDDVENTEPIQFGFRTRSERKPTSTFGISAVTTEREADHVELGVGSVYASGESRSGVDGSQDGWVVGGDGVPKESGILEPKLNNA